MKKFFKHFFRFCLVAILIVATPLLMLAGFIVYDPFWQSLLVTSGCVSSIAAFIFGCKFQSDYEKENHFGAW